MLHRYRQKPPEPRAHRAPPASGRPVRPLRLIALVLFAAAAAAGAAPFDEDALRRRGIAALPAALAHVEAEDPGTRLRARRLVRAMVLAFYREQTPDGMRLVAPRLEITRKGIAVHGGSYLAVHETTVAEFRAFAAAKKLPPGPWDEGEGDGELPVARVSFAEARAYATWKGARLPTAAELAAAATAAGTRRYPWGDRLDPRRANTREAGVLAREPVGARPSGRSPHGLADLAGNVAEWTATVRGEGARARHDVVGGSFRRPLRGTDFVTYRLRAAERQPDVGFRLARSLPPLPS